MALTPEQFAKLTDRLSSFSEPPVVPSKGPGMAKNITESFKSRVGQAQEQQERAVAGDIGLGQGVLRTIGAGAGFVGDVGGEVLKAGVKAVLPPSGEEAVKSGLQAIFGSRPVQEIASQYESFRQKYPEASKDLEAFTSIASLVPAGLGTKAIAGTVAKAGEKAFGIAGKAAESAVIKPVSKTIDAFGDVIQRVNAPDVSDATRLSLNPVASKDLAPELKISVGGKLKPISEITPTENAKIKVSTEKGLDFFKTQAEKFKNERNPLNDPTEIVGQRVDKALGFADRKRQVVGQKMGDIEAKYAQKPLAVSPKTSDKFLETIKDFDNPRFGADTADSQVVRKLVSDFDSLNSTKSTIGDRLQFVRAWEKYLNDAKDGFGNFKDNATVNTRIQNAVKAIKEETVNYITDTDKAYRNLRNQYRTYKQLDEFGNRLLGKEGMLGDRIRGGATVKRALKSNSDAGARQFLIKLKEITGYDAIKDGDIALTAMDLVGDYQGLSLLEVLSEGKGGILKRIGEKAQDIVTGGKEERIRKFIKK